MTHKSDVQRSYPPEYVSADTVAYLLDCSRSTLDDYVRRGLLPRRTGTARVSFVSRPRMPKLALPAHVHMVRSRGREYFYFQPFRGTKREHPRTPLQGCPVNPDGTPTTSSKSICSIVRVACPGRSTSTVNRRRASTG